MSVTTTVFQGIGGTIDNATATFVSSVSSDMIATISPWAISGAALTFVLYGYLIMAGKIQQPGPDFLIKSVKIAIIGALALNAGTYMDWVVGTLKGLEESLAAAVSNGGGGSIYATLDSSLGKGMDIIAQCLEQAKASGWTELPTAIGWYICAVLIAIGLTLVVVVGGIAIIMSTMMLKVLFAIGPVFIMSLMFPVTARFFDSWIGYVLNHILIVVLTAAVLTLGVTIYDAQLSKVVVGDGDQNLLLVAFELVVIAAILYALVKGAAGAAAALAGGLSMAVMGVSQMAGAARTASNVAKGTASVGKGAAKLGKGIFTGTAKASEWVGGKAFQMAGIGGNSVSQGGGGTPAFRQGIQNLMQRQNQPGISGGR